MTFPLTPMLDLSPADSDACSGTPLPINLSNLECRTFLAAEIDATTAQAPITGPARKQAAFRSHAPTKTQRQAPTSLRHYPHSAPPPAASFNPASMRSHSRPVLLVLSPTRPHRTLKIPESTAA